MTGWVRVWVQNLAVVGNDPHVGQVVRGWGGDMWRKTGKVWKSRNSVLPACVNPTSNSASDIDTHTQTVTCTKKPRYLTLNTFNFHYLGFSSNICKWMQPTRQLYLPKQDRTKPTDVCKQLAIKTFRLCARTAPVSCYRSPPSVPSHMYLSVRWAGNKVIWPLQVFLSFKEAM